MKPRILIVEDDLIVATNIKEKLKYKGYSVVGCCREGESVYAESTRLKPDLILMDIKLSGNMDGIDTAKRIYSRLSIPIVYLSAYSDEKTFQRAKFTEPFGFLLKPFIDQELYNVVELALYKHKIEMKLRDSEERFRRVSELTSDFAYSCCVDKDGRFNFEWITAAITKISGYSPREIKNKRSWEILFHPDDLQIAHDQLESLMEGKSKSVEYRIVTKKGDIKWMYNSAKPVWSQEEKRTVQIYGAVQDITERKNSEQILEQMNIQLEKRVQQRTKELVQANRGLKEEIRKRKAVERKHRESENRLRALMNASTDAAFLINRDGTMALCNRSLVKILDLRQKDFIGKTFEKLNIFSDELLEKRINIFKKVIKSGKLYRYEDCHINRWYYVTMNPILNSEGKVTQIAFFTRDITDEKNALKAMEISENKYRTLIESLPDILYTVDIKGDIEFVNDAVEILGYTPNELIGQPISMIILPEDKERYESFFKVRKTGRAGTRNIEIRLRRKDDTICHALLNAQGIYERTEPNEKKDYIGTFGIIRDITNRIKIQKEKEWLLRKIIKEEKLVTLGQFTSSIAHELNNSLDIILTKFSLMKKKFSKSGSQSIANDYIKSIDKQFHRLRHLGTDILQYVTPRDIIFKPVNMNTIIEEVIESCSRYFLDGVQLHLELSPNLFLVSGDWMGLEIMYKNIILNGIETIHQKGQMKIITRNIKHKDIEIIIEDTGEGITEKNLSRIFNPFFSTKRESGGTGLGLPMCKTIVQEHRGTIKIQSKHGIGTTVLISFPVLKRNEKQY